MEMFGKKKSKKTKKKPFNLDELTDALTDSVGKDGAGEDGDEKEAPASAPSADVDSFDLEMDFRNAKKKRAKKRPGLRELITKEETVGDGDDKEIGECPCVFSIYFVLRILW